MWLSVSYEAIKVCFQGDIVTDESMSRQPVMYSPAGHL